MACRFKKRMKLGGILKDVGKLALDMNPISFASNAITGKTIGDFAGMEYNSSALQKGTDVFMGASKAVAPAILDTFAPGSGAALTATQQMVSPMVGNQEISKERQIAEGVAGGLSGAVGMLGSQGAMGMAGVPTMQYGGNIPATKFDGEDGIIDGIDLDIAMVDKDEVLWDDPKGFKYIFSNSLNNNGEIKRKSNIRKKSG